MWYVTKDNNLTQKLIRNKESNMIHLQDRIAELEKEGKLENIDFRVVHFSDTAELKILDNNDTKKELR